MAQFTKKAIIETFVELLETTPFDKISVIDIAERCGINRNTFYYHFPDIYALVDELLHLETQKIVEENVNYDSWQEAFLNAIRFARLNKKAIYHLFNSTNRDRLEKYFYDVTINSVSIIIRKESEGLNVREEDVKALSEFYASALIGTGIRWLKEGMKQNLEEYINEMGTLLDGSIRYTLSKCNKTIKSGKEE